MTSKGVSTARYTTGADATNPDSGHNLPSNAAPKVIGAQFGISVTLGIGNATTQKEFGGESRSLSFGGGLLGRLSFSWNSGSDGIHSLQVSIGVGAGLSSSAVTTDTTVE